MNNKFFIVVACIMMSLDLHAATVFIEEMRPVASGGSITAVRFGFSDSISGATENIEQISNCRKYGINCEVVGRCKGSNWSALVSSRGGELHQGWTCGKSKGETALDIAANEAKKNGGSSRCYDFIVNYDDNSNQSVSPGTARMGSNITWIGTITADGELLDKQICNSGHCEELIPINYDQRGSRCSN